jgi:molybdopterin converting factor subunit 1
MNTVEVHLFARARDLAGAARVTVRLGAGATVGDLRRRLAAEHRELADLLSRSALAVNHEFAEDTLTVPHAAEVALLPPVSGGAWGSGNASW